MGKKHKLLSIFLLTSIATSIFSGILSISKERYERSEAEAVTSYKTVYLYVPNSVANYSNVETTVVWDEVESQVTIYDKVNKTYPVMIKLQTNLYSFTLANTNNSY